MTKIIGIVGSGMIGRNPWDPNCWSRSGYNLFTTLKARGVLEQAVGVEVPFILRAPIMLKNFSFTKRIWRQKFNLDPTYYEMLTRQIGLAKKKNSFGKDSVILQIGGHYNAAKATGQKAYSYHDGNIAGLMKSPHFPKDLLPYAERAFQFEKNVYKDMTKIFVMSEYWRRSFIEEFNVPSDKVVNVGFGVNIEIPQPFEKNYLKKNIIFVGIDFERKGGNALINAFKRVQLTHSDATLHIVGPRTKPSILESESKGIEFHGLLSREVPEQKAKLEQLFREGTVFVLPSLYEPFGNAALEAMLYKMPVITTNDWSFPDFVIPGKTGILLDKKNNPDEIANAINVLLSAPQDRKNFGENGYQLVTQKYTWDNTIKNIINAINT